jgi:uncharacterized protein
MGERTQYTPGTFSWTDLATTDPAAAKEFYSAILGWDYNDIDTGQGTYSMAQVGGKDVAAIAGQPEQMQGMPPFWMSYVTVEDADATAAKAKELGGNVMNEPFDVFESGRMAIIQDPQGAIFAIWQPKQHIGAGLVNEPGSLVWNQLSSPDREASKRFYGDLFGWTYDDATESGMDTSLIKLGEKNNGGVAGLPSPEVPPNWGVAFTVSDIDEAAEKVKAAGGQLMMGPEQMGEIGHTLVAADPQGGIFALYSGQIDD